MVCVSAVPPSAVVPARNLCKRLKEQCPDVTLLAGIWNAKAQPIEIANRFSHWTAGAVTRLTAAAARFEELLKAPAPPRTIAHAPERDSEPEELFDGVVREVAKVFQVPVSLVSLIRSNAAYWNEHLKGSAEEGGNGGMKDGGLCNQVESANDIVVVEDISHDARLSELPCFKERGIQFFAGAPLCNDEGHAVGTICVTDAKPHPVTERQKSAFREITQRFMGQLNGKQLAAA
jgi:hypothetical protein